MLQAWASLKRYTTDQLAEMEEATRYLDGRHRGAQCIYCINAFGTTSAPVESWIDIGIQHAGTGSCVCSTLPLMC